MTIVAATKSPANQLRPITHNKIRLMQARKMENGYSQVDPYVKLRPKSLISRKDVYS